MTTEEAIELGKRAIFHATHRDAYSGGIINGFFINNFFFIFNFYFYSLPYFFYRMEKNLFTRLFFNI